MNFAKAVAARLSLPKQDRLYYEDTKGEDYYPLVNYLVWF